MRAVVLNGDRADDGRWLRPRVEFQDVAEIGSIGADEVLIAPRVVGLCGSDVACLSRDAAGFMRFPGPAHLPVVLGHEIAGTVLGVGAQVAMVRTGQCVAVESVQSCASCPPCRAGHPNQCDAIELLGLTRDGGLAGQLVAKARHVHPLDRLVQRWGVGAALDLGAMLEPAGCAYNALYVQPNGQIVPRVNHDSRVAIFGAGPIGLLAVLLARAAGAGLIVVFERNERRAELARRLGADVAYSHCVGNADVLESFREVAAGARATFALEAAGSGDAIRAAIELLGPRGVLAIAGRIAGDVAVDFNPVVSKALSVHGVRGHSGYRIFPTLIELLASGAVDLRPLIGARYPFERALEALEHARRLFAGKLLVDVDGKEN